MAVSDGEEQEQEAIDSSTRPSLLATVENSDHLAIIIIAIISASAKKRGTQLLVAVTTSMKNYVQFIN